ncbi:hypothetical protein LMH87_009659 [Akanthomyces muscarius]|uniref:Mid2 domain-containing protein n=1 Tax=Akanthomyces muscarius TaxID=2231603 RepID=A0A9W8QDD5_AKAMU|nr:hypothetical protein LMH87_009659 [Akanthomyces muscarius]KAJ4153157.1 hypothetical protein LMH87_009659 [Akanthomyces muscarius]
MGSSLAGRSSSDTVAAIKQELMLAPRANNVIFSKSSEIDSSIEDFPLFKISEKGPNGTTIGTEIICQKCYVKGHASATMTAKGDFNITTAATSIKASVNSTLHQIADYASNVVHDMKVYIADNANVLIEDVTHLKSLDNLQGFRLNPPGITLDVDVGKLDDVLLEVVFTEIELYVELSILFSAGTTYTLNLYTSSELGYEVGRVFVGFVATIDLILSVESQIELDSGFHIKFDKQMAMKLALFSEETSHLEFHGGRFEFLPVTVATAGAVLHAVLRIGIKSGFSLSAGFGPEVQLFNQTGHLQLGAGIQASAYANAAEFITNITFAGSDLSSSVKERGDDACHLMLQQGYQMAIGAAAGASVELLDNVWGPTPKTEIPIFYTALSTGCAATRAAAAEIQQSASLATRANNGDGSSTITTTATAVTHIALQCLSVGMTNCPASLKSRVTSVVSTTLTATARSGESVIWSAVAAQTKPAKPVVFGANALTMTASSGKPSSYVPPAPTTTLGDKGDKGGGKDGESIKGSVVGTNKVIIGVCVGLGVPLLAAVIAAIIFAKTRNRKRYDSVPRVTMEATDAEHEGGSAAIAPSLTKHSQSFSAHTYTPVNR